MLRRVKTHVNYKKDGVVIRPATLHEEYDIGNWTKYYDWIKLGYEYSEYESLYSDILYVMTINGSLIGYFLAYNRVNTGDNPNIPLYNKEMVVYDLVVDVRAYAKYTKILMDYIIKYSNYNGYKAVAFYKVDKCNKFTNFLNKNYHVTEIENKLYLYNENPRIRTCQKYLTIYKEDKLSLEDLYFLYDLRFDVLKTKCKFSFNEYQIVVDRLADLIDSIPDNPLYDESQIESHVLYKFKKEEPFTITKDQDGTFVISGEEVERIFKMTKFSSDDAAYRFAKKLRKMGIDNKLLEMGAEEGDMVRILNFYFEFKD